MSLCRYLPTPSDRMGVIWSLLSVKDSIVLEYGPAGTTHYSMGLYGSLGLEFNERIFTTHMSEDDVVMGDVTRLEESIVELDEGYNPKVIFVVASSISNIIGTDLKGVCRYMQADVKAKLIALERGGFQGDYSAGIQEAYKLLAKELAQPNVEKVPNTFNILGASMGDFRITSDIWEIGNLLQEGFGMKMHTSLCTDTSVAAIETMGSAELNLVLRPEAEGAGKILEEKTGTPFVLGMPYGYAGTVEWLQKIAATLGRPCNPALIARLTQKARMHMPLSGMMAMMRRKYKPQAVVDADYMSVLGLSQFLESIGFAVTRKLSKHSLKNIPEAPEDIVYYKEEGDKLQALKEVEHSLIFGNAITFVATNDTNTKVPFSFPLIEGANIATHLPFAGEKGADYLMEQMEIYLGRL